MFKGDKNKNKNTITAITRSIKHEKSWNIAARQAKNSWHINKKISIRTER